MSQRMKPEHIVRDILVGSSHIVSFQGRSQYTAGGGGASACGFAAFNCVRIALGREQAGQHDGELIRSMLGRETMEEILDVCLRWSGSNHLDVDEIYEAPLFKDALVLERSEFQSPSLQQFTDLLERLKNTSALGVGAIITRPPEIVAVLKLPVEHDSEIFVIFDSHPREAHPNGAGLIFNKSLPSTAAYLADLFKFDQGLLEDESLQWQAQLLANFSAHIFTANHKIQDLNYHSEALLDASLALLAIKAEISRVTQENTSLQEASRQAHEQADRLEVDVDSLRHELSALKRSNGGRRSGVLNSSHAASSTSTKHAVLHLTASSSSSAAHFGHLQSSSNGYSVEDEDDPDVRYARQVERDFAGEDSLLSAQLHALKAEVPSTFECGICLESETEHMVCRFDSCGHPFCRDCVRSYLKSKLKEHRFPIMCPTCATNKDGPNPGSVSSVIAETIGLSQDEYKVFIELELVAFSVLMHCRKCQGEAFVDRQEYQDARILSCPIPGCNHVWCKSCSQEIDYSGPPHSCDGTTELNHLMQEQGWKHCPGCRTPTEKSSGCNHMTCMSPGCNMHFCYVCGESIVRSVLRDDIRRAVSQHYAKCRLFEVPRDLTRRRR